MRLSAVGLPLVPRPKLTKIPENSSPKIVFRRHAGWVRQAPRALGLQIISVNRRKNRKNQPLRRNTAGVRRGCSRSPLARRATRGVGTTECVLLEILEYRQNLQNLRFSGLASTRMVRHMDKSASTSSVQSWLWTLAAGAFCACLAIAGVWLASDRVFLLDVLRGLIGFVSTPFFFEATVFMLGLSAVVAYNHWRGKRDGEDWVEMEVPAAEASSQYAPNSPTKPNRSAHPVENSPQS